MDLKKLKVQEMNKKEMKKIDGGIWHYVAGFLGALAWSAWENVGDIRDGWNDGINGQPPRYK